MLIMEVDQNISIFNIFIGEAGVSAIVMEDKIGLKRNSLFLDQSKSKQDTIKNFSNKIKIASNSRKYKDFLIVARIESLILGEE